ncbi:MAG: hypothetical protein CL912_22940 [Deltaproteobacteria bacterium]|nr:hypothetical protein [Deltaproteobacteria bacterium]
MFSLCRSDASSETSSCDSSNNSTLVEPRRSRYIRREHPTGHRKHQAWIKVSSLTHLSTGRVENIQDGVQAGSGRGFSLSTSQGSNGKSDDTPIPPSKLPAKYRHGRKKKTVYRGPICYNCAGKHHIRDCGLKMLKGKRARKGKRTEKRNWS